MLTRRQTFKGLLAALAASFLPVASKPLEELSFSRWIDVKDDLPDSGTPVLATNHVHLGLATLTLDKRWFWLYAVQQITPTVVNPTGDIFPEAYILPIKHWQPLPFLSSEKSQFNVASHSGFWGIPDWARRSYPPTVGTKLIAI